jgi:biopolymer transport protein ExbD
MQLYFASILLALAAQAPVPRAGVSVQLATTQHAQPLPEADQPEAVVIALTASGKLYLGITPITPAALPRTLPRTKTLCFKADARAPYSAIVEVLDSLRHLGVSSVWLITGQQDTPEPANPVPPKGFELRLTPATRPPSRP